MYNGVKAMIEAEKALGGGGVKIEEKSEPINDETV
jgi:hypothetical protein